MQMTQARAKAKKQLAQAAVAGATTSTTTKVYALKTYEPLQTRLDALDEMPSLYATREAAEAAAKAYNEEFNDAEPATVVEIEVKEKNMDNTKTNTDADLRTVRVTMSFELQRHEDISDIALDVRETTVFVDGLIEDSVRVEIEEANAAQTDARG